MNVPGVTRSVLANGVTMLGFPSGLGMVEIGLLHGRALREEIQACLRFIKAYIEKACVRSQWPKPLHNFYTHCEQYAKDTKLYLGDVYDELCGIAKGAGCTLEDMFLLNCLDELSIFLFDVAPSGKCTALGIYAEKGQSVLVAQNLDFFSFFNEFQVLFRIPYPRSSTLLYGFAGQCMGMSVNRHGIGVVSTTIADGAFSENTGVPNTFLLKALCLCTNLEECAALLERCPNSTSTGWIIGQGERLLAMETTASSVVYGPQWETSGLAHTNHLLYSNDRLPYASLPPEESATSFSLERLALAQQWLAGLQPVNTIEDIQAFLSTPPVYKISSGDITLQSFIAVCDMDTPCAYIAGAQNRMFCRLLLEE